MAIIASIIAWVTSNAVNIGIVIGGLIAIDEVLLQMFPNSAESSFLLRIKEILGQIAGVLLKLFPSNNGGNGAPPPAA